MVALIMHGLAFLSPACSLFLTTLPWITIGEVDSGRTAEIVGDVPSEERPAVARTSCRRFFTFVVYIDIDVFRGVLCCVVVRFPMLMGDIYYRYYCARNLVAPETTTIEYKNTWPHVRAK